MPTPPSCFDVQTIDNTVVARIRSEAVNTLPREFAIEINALRPKLAQLGRQNLLFEVEPACVLAADHLRALVFLIRDARQRGATCAFCGGGPDLQQTLSRFGLNKPADWFPTQLAALAAIQGRPAPPAPLAAPHLPYQHPPFAPPPPPPPQVGVPPAAPPPPAPVAARPANRAPPPRARERLLAAHELTLRAHLRQSILEIPEICAHLAERIRAESDHFGFSVWAFVFMPDHFHLLVQSQQLNYDVGDYLDAIKQSFQERAIEILAEHSPQVLSRLRKQQGSKIDYDFWQRTTGQNRNVDFSRPLRPLINHLHENPVRKGLVTDPLEWKWSSAGAYAGRPLPQLQPDTVPPELLGN
jgi:putative transposase